MAYMPVAMENGAPIELYYEDYGEGRPVVLVHGWPLDGRMWEHQVSALVEAGYRVIAYDRRGFGRSTRPWDGYDYDTLAIDLQTLLEHLDLRECTLVGFCSGAGEVVRAIRNHGDERVAGVVLVSAVPPFLYRSYDNPGGLLNDDAVAAIKRGIADDRIAFLDSFATDLFRPGEAEVLVSEVHRVSFRDMATLASPRATSEHAIAFMRTDFRVDLAGLKVPTLIVHGDRDVVVPVEGSGMRSHKAVRGSEMVLIEGGPHCCNITHAGRFNRALLGFLARCDPDHHGTRSRQPDGGETVENSDRARSK